MIDRRTIYTDKDCPLDCGISCKHRHPTESAKDVDVVMKIEQTKQDWEARFDENFVGSYGTGFPVMQERIKAFIRDLIAAARKEEREAIVRLAQEMKRGKVEADGKLWAAHYLGHDEAIDNLIRKLQETEPNGANAWNAATDWIKNKLDSETEPNNSVNDREI